MRHYIITMAIRTACLVLLVAVQPLGWWSWIFALGAAFLPYIAVVFANNPVAAKTTGIEDPSIAIESDKPEQRIRETPPSVITISESPTTHTTPGAPDPSTTGGPS